MHRELRQVDLTDVQDPFYTPKLAATLLAANAKSPAMQKVLVHIKRCAKVKLPLLIRGETGTGKDLVAQAIHETRAAKAPLAVLNCGAIAEKLAESELFGHRKGAFTGASQSHRGVFERAAQGTVFLDELGELPLELQAKLLRVLENGRFLPLGADKELHSKASIIAATHRPLEEWIAQGLFREDLFYRINILSISLPPLRERKKDIPGLFQLFAKQAEQQLGRELAIEPGAIQWAQTQRWPGNLRQLRNLVLRCAVLGDASIQKSQLQENYLQSPVTTSGGADRVQITRSDFASMKQELLRDALSRQGNLRLAATKLGVPKSTLAGWLKKSHAITPSISKTG